MTNAVVEVAHAQAEPQLVELERVLREELALRLALLQPRELRERGDRLALLRDRERDEAGRDERQREQRPRRARGGRVQLLPEDIGARGHGVEGLDSR